MPQPDSSGPSPSPASHQLCVSVFSSVKWVFVATTRVTIYTPVCNKHHSRASFSVPQHSLDIAGAREIIPPPSSPLSGKGLGKPPPLEDQVFPTEARCWPVNHKPLTTAESATPRACLLGRDVAGVHRRIHFEWRQE